MTSEFLLENLTLGRKWKVRESVLSHLPFFRCLQLKTINIAKWYILGHILEWYILLPFRTKSLRWLQNNLGGLRASDTISSASLIRQRNEVLRPPHYDSTSVRSPCAPKMMAFIACEPM